MVKDFEDLDLSKRYTYADYLTWQFDEMVELIKGKVFKMSPAPSTRHQLVSGNLYRLISNYLFRKPCLAFAAPFDVRLTTSSTTETSITTVVQPDITVICDRAKIDEQGCNGSPDLIVEILSKGTAKKDLNEKFDLYEAAGVKEYWIVHPTEATVLVYKLNENAQYEAIRKRPFTIGDQVSSTIFSNLSIDLDLVFED